MSISRTVSVVLGIAAVAFGVGRWTAPIDVVRAAHADPIPDDKAAPADVEADAAAEMEAWEAAGRRGAPHEVLDVLAGDWTGEVRVWMAPDQDAMTFPTRVRREWIFDGRFLREDVESDTDWGVFRGLGFMGYSNVDRVYQFAWMENHGTTIDLQSGSYDPDTKQLITRGGYRHPHTGRYVLTRSVFDLSNDNRHVAHAYATDENGREYVSFEGVFTREK